MWKKKTRELESMTTPSLGSNSWLFLICHMYSLFIDWSRNGKGASNNLGKEQNRSILASAINIVGVSVHVFNTLLQLKLAVVHSYVIVCKLTKTDWCWSPFYCCDVIILFLSFRVWSQCGYCATRRSSDHRELPPEALQSLNLDLAPGNWGLMYETQQDMNLSQLWPLDWTRNSISGSATLERLHWWRIFLHELINLTTGDKRNFVIFSWINIALLQTTTRCLTPDATNRAEFPLKWDSSRDMMKCFISS